MRIPAAIDSCFLRNAVYILLVGPHLIGTRDTRADIVAFNYELTYSLTADYSWSVADGTAQDGDITLCAGGDTVHLGGGREGETLSLSESAAESSTCFPARFSAFVRVNRFLPSTSETNGQSVFAIAIDAGAVLVPPEEEPGDPDRLTEADFAASARIVLEFDLVDWHTVRIEPRDASYTLEGPLSGPFRGLVAVQADEPGQIVSLWPGRYRWTVTAELEDQNLGIRELSSAPPTTQDTLVVDIDGDGDLDRFDLIVWSRDPIDLNGDQSVDDEDLGWLTHWAKVSDTLLADCDDNGVLDSIQIGVDSQLDEDQNGLLDSCEVAPTWKFGEQLGGGLTAHSAPVVVGAAILTQVCSDTSDAPLAAVPIAYGAIGSIQEIDNEALGGQNFRTFRGGGSNVAISTSDPGGEHWLQVWTFDELERSLVRTVRTPISGFLPAGAVSGDVCGINSDGTVGWVSSLANGSSRPEFFLSIIATDDEAPTLVETFGPFPDRPCSYDNGLVVIADPLRSDLVAAPTLAPSEIDGIRPAAGPNRGSQRYDAREIILRDGVALAMTDRYLRYLDGGSESTGLRQRSFVRLIRRPVAFDGSWIAASRTDLLDILEIDESGFPVFRARLSGDDYDSVAVEFPYVVWRSDSRDASPADRGLAVLDLRELSRCRADRNGDHRLGTEDVARFLEELALGLIGSDFEPTQVPGEIELDVFDVLAFLRSFDQGCDAADTPASPLEAP